MKLKPHEEISDFPNGLNGYFNLTKDCEFLDASAELTLNQVKGYNQNWYRGISAYMFNAQILLEFDEGYKITSCEFRPPFKALGAELLHHDHNLLLPNISDAKDLMETIGTFVSVSDSGFHADEIGVSFYSSEYGDDTHSPLDAVTVHFAD